MPTANSNNQITNSKLFVIWKIGHWLFASSPSHFGLPCYPEGRGQGLRISLSAPFTIHYSLFTAFPPPAFIPQ